VNKFLTVIFLIFIIYIPVFSEDQKIFSLNRYPDLYRDLEILLWEVGEVSVSSAYPYSKAEFDYILRDIDKSKLSDSGLKRFDSIKEILTKDESNSDFTSTFDLELNAEGYYKTNADNNNWLYGYNQRKPVIKMDFAFGFNNIFWGTLDIPVQKGKDFLRFKENPETNISLLWNTTQMDMQFPFTALSSVGGKNWNILFGRDILSIGHGQSGNLVLSDAASFHEFIRASTFWDSFKYTFTILNIEALNVPGQTSYDAKHPKIKILINHNFEFRPFKNLSIALNESTIRGGTDLTLNYFNPLMVIHNLALTDRTTGSTLGNSLLSISGSYTPVKNINIYGEFVLDQFETPAEEGMLGGSGKGDPNAFAYLYGANYNLNLGEISLVFNGEYALTYPYMYRTSTSWALYGLTRLYHSVYNNSNDYTLEPLGYGYGPDAQVIKFSVASSLFDNSLRISLDYNNILLGDSDLGDKMETGLTAMQKRTPSGNSTTGNVITFKIDWNFIEHFTLFSQIDSIWGTIQDTQIAFGARFNL